MDEIRSFSYDAAMPLHAFRDVRFSLFRMLPWAVSARAAKSIPWHRTLFCPRGIEKRPRGHRTRRHPDGVQGVEFYAPYFEWSESQTKADEKASGRSGIRGFLDAQRQFLSESGEIGGA